jgi:hypothetical protein
MGGGRAATTGGSRRDHEYPSENLIENPRENTRAREDARDSLPGAVRKNPEKMPETAEAERARLYAVTDRWRRERAAK